jgi:hypothetical protein
MTFKAIRAAHETFEAQYPDWFVAARAIGTNIAKDRGVVTVNDVQAVIDHPKGADARIWGSVFRSKDFHVAGRVAVASTNPLLCSRMRNVTEWTLEDTLSKSIEMIREGLFVWYDEAGQVGGASNYYAEANKQLTAYAEAL